LLVYPEADLTYYF